MISVQKLFIVSKNAGFLKSTRTKSLSNLDALINDIILSYSLFLMVYSQMLLQIAIRSSLSKFCCLLLSNVIDFIAASIL